MDLRFSVIIPVLNLRGNLGLLMRCLEAQTFPRDRFECIVVDDGSADGSRSYLDSYSAGFTLRVLHHPRTLGRSAARNLGCRHAHGQILVFLDGDVLPCPSWLSEYDSGFLTLNADVLSGGRYSVTVDPTSAPPHLSALLRVAPDDLFRSDVATHFQTLASRARVGQYPTPLYERLERELAQVCQEVPSSVLSAFSLITSNVAVYRAAFEKTKRFDPFIVRMQDTELGLQLWEAGCRFDFATAAAAYHLFYPAFVDPDAAYRDVLSVFIRHPYTIVLKMACWGLHKAAPSTKERLGYLARCPAAKLDLGEQFVATFNRPVPANCHYSLDQIVEYAQEQSGLTKHEVQTLVNKGLAAGLHVEHRDHIAYLDRQLTINWLQSNTTYRQAELRQNCCVSYPSLLQRAAVSADGSAVLECRGRYEVVVPARLFTDAVGEVKMQVPRPVPHPSHQDVQVWSFRPPRVAECDRGDRIEYSWRVDAAPQQIVVGYDFACSLRQVVKTNDGYGEDDLARYRACGLPPAYRERAMALLKRIALGPDAGDRGRAHIIYQWILDHYAFREALSPSVQVFETGAGPCTHAVRLFVEICRLAGIAARQRCGALVQRGVVNGAVHRVEVVERGYSPFVHTWAEFHDSETGWVPVEFLGWMLGSRSLTARNVDDVALRAQVAEHTEFYDRYFFGRLDPFRIHTSAAASRLRTYPIPTRDASWNHLYRALFETRHQLSCTIVARQPAAHPVAWRDQSPPP